MINLLSLNQVFKDLEDSRESIQFELDREFIEIYNEMVINFEDYKTKLHKLLKLEHLIKSTKYLWWQEGEIDSLFLTMDDCVRKLHELLENRKGA